LGSGEADLVTLAGDGKEAIITVIVVRTLSTTPFRTTGETPHQSAWR
jgi:hypothetical protein